MKLKFITLTLPLFFLLASCGSNSSENSNANRDTSENAPEQIASPMNKISGEIDGVEVSMQYSSPGVKKRKVWGELVPYGEVWRTGADEATWIEFKSDVLVEGQKVPKGKYSLFTIPNQNEWTLILNKDWEQWGAFDYKQEDDILRVAIIPQINGDKQERLKFSIEDKIIFTWDKLIFSVNIASAKNS
ncbi:DUF2911 domain-containing protein [Flammeovirgaceae bacterium SG7u.111]|nr:DUF2911 domain-containing protein [Flammeovirgaceae bacterium SG7u.132]WPO35543.1 DUF2911 domain-containing protein [Flammeovirgaceae bacterium SG7u.111]